MKVDPTQLDALIEEANVGPKAAKALREANTTNTTGGHGAPTPSTSGTPRI
jgi:hypothetical protein